MDPPPFLAKGWAPVAAGPGRGLEGGFARIGGAADGREGGRGHP